MAISLYPHNQTAYEAAVAMLAGSGKAAIIHPTGKAWKSTRGASSRRKAWKRC